MLVRKRGGPDPAFHPHLLAFPTPATSPTAHTHRHERCGKISLFHDPRQLTSQKALHSGRRVVDMGAEGARRQVHGALPRAAALFPVLLRRMKDAPPGGPQDLRLLPEALQKSEEGVAGREH